MLDLNGNCKEDFLIKDAIDKGMNIVADSIEEFENICSIAKAQNKRPKVLLRISGYELEDITSDSYFTSGLWTKFGVPLKEIPKFITTIKNYPQIEFVGFHTHIGSQIAQLEPYLAVLGKMIEMCALLNSTGVQCKVLNLGGGFPVRYVEKETWDYIVQRIRQGYLDAEAGDTKHVFVWHDGLAGFATETNAKIHLEKWTGERFYTPYPKEKMLEAVLKGQVKVNGETVSAVKALQDIGSPTLTIEPGRSVVEDAGVTLAKVGIVRKVAYEHDLVTIELGVTSHCESLLEKPVRKWEIANDHDRKDEKQFEAFIGGNLCFSGDMISKYKVFLQRKPKRGEVLIIHDTGAYSSSLMSANSNSFPRPARVLMKEDGAKVVMKKRDEFEQIFS
jgi:diaminopimelate decarboxylase